MDRSNVMPSSNRKPWEKERFHCPMLFVPVLASEEHNVSSMHPESTFTRFQLAQWWWG